MRYYISDLHFFHESLNTQMDCRGFKDAAQMNAYMIKQWNSRVRTRDEVVILGDFSVGKAEQTNEILNQLNGRLYMIKGNHDRYLKESEFNKERFVWIKPYAEMHDNRRKVVLSHYPIFCYNGQYRRNKKGEPLTYMLYGHVHNTREWQLVEKWKHEQWDMGIPSRLINVGCMMDYMRYTPRTLEELLDANPMPIFDRIRQDGTPVDSPSEDSCSG